MRSTLTLSTVFIVILTACATAPPIRHEPDNLVWPKPPEKPRIKYVRSIYSEDDLGGAYTLKEILFGKSYVETLNRPYGVFAQAGRLYITDIVDRQVSVYDLDGKRAVPIGGEGAVRLPSAIVPGSQGAVYVADAAQSKIAVYDNEGRYRTAFALGSVKPVALAFNPALGRLYVLDRSNHKVLVLDPDGRVLFEFGRRGAENGEFNIPLGIAVDRDGTVYVLDSGNFRVQIFDPDGTFLGKFGEVGDRPGFFSNPKGIAVDSEGHIYVTDAAFSNFQIFDREGNILLFVGGLGSAPGQLYLPATISIDEQDRIFIADQLNSRIAVYQYLRAERSPD